MSSSSADKYNSKVKTWLQGIKPGWRIIDEICREENRDMFIQAIKAYIDEDWGDVYFSSDYKKLRKIIIPEFLTKTVEA